MRDLNGQSNPLHAGYGRGSPGSPEAPNLLLPRRRGLGLPLALGASTAAIALAGFLVLSELAEDIDAELPPASSPLEVVKGPTESFTGSLAIAQRVPPAPAPAPIERVTETRELGQPAPAADRDRPSVVASASPILELPSSLPASSAPAPSPAPTAAAAPAAPPAPVASAPVSEEAVPLAPKPPVHKPRTGPSAAEITALLSRARDLIGSGDIAGARLLLERAASGEDGPALAALAETYDPEMLARWGVLGFVPNPEKAKTLYEKAAERGVSAARERMMALR